MSNAPPLPRPERVPSAPFTPGPFLRPVWAEINLAALRHNTRIALEKAGPAKVMAVVKADGYGHGLEPAARAMLEAGAPWLAVATADEAKALRALRGMERIPILVMAPTFPEEAEAVQRCDAAFSVGAVELLRHHLEVARRRGGRARVHIQLDTGIGRDGFRWDDFSYLDAFRGAEEHFEGLFTHFSCSDSDDEEKRAYTTLQIERFNRAIERVREAGFRPFCHAANSAALVSRTEECRYDGVRPGIMLYGIDPFGADYRRWGLRQVMRFASRLSAVRTVEPGDPISYDRLWTVPSRRKIAVVPVGYGDGYMVALTNLSEVVVRGRRVPARGRVCMDQFMVDLEDVPEARVGDEVVLYGRQGDAEVPLEEVAKWARTIPYEIACGVLPRVPRVYTDDETATGVPQQ